MDSGTKLDRINLSQAAIRLHPADPLVIARVFLKAGTHIIEDEPGPPQSELILAQDVPAGHKIATRFIEAGEPIQRYGQKIGIATKSIHAGDWIHCHNLDVGDLNREFEIQVIPGKGQISDSGPARFFFGYPRPKGEFGTRNQILVISTVSCSAQTVQGIAAHFTPERMSEFPHVDGVEAIIHSSGCTIPENGLAYRYLARLLLNLQRNPNCAQAIFVGLGCEVLQIEKAAQLLLAEDPTAAEMLSGLRKLVIQEAGGVERTTKAGIEMVYGLLEKANQIERQIAPLSALRVGLECGGSDGWSGVTANPLVGLVSDRLVSLGGTVILSETPEIYGAEQMFTRRVRSVEVGQKLIDRIRFWQSQAERLGFSLDNNPTPGNKAGGLTTIFEKSLGAAAKGGSSPLMGVVEYAQVIREQGLVFMDTPGYDPASVAGMIAGGCNLVLFTTGCGSAYSGVVAPCIKIASNSPLYQRMMPDMDYNAGQILDGKSIATAALELFELVIDTASGKRTRGEEKTYRSAEFIPWHPDSML